MNYTKLYQELIASRKLLNRSKETGIYEKHHILPRSLGGLNNKENIILLTPKEHYIAHLLLVYMYEGKNKSKMSYALFRMCQNNPYQNRKISSNQFNTSKLIMIKNCSGINGSFYGKKHTQESKNKCREAKLGDKNPSRIYGVWNKGIKMKPLSKETKEKISLANKDQKRSLNTKQKMSNSAKGKIKSESHKKALSLANLGKKLSQNTKNKMSLAHKGVKQTILKCPHCNKEGGTTMHRWHFDNCKFNILNN